VKYKITPHIFVLQKELFAGFSDCKNYFLIAANRLTAKCKFHTMKTENVEKTRYSDSELQEFEQLIDEKIEKAREQLEYYLNQIQEFGESQDAKQKNLDDGTTTAETERLYTLASRQRKLIQHLDNAKLRIKNKVYGVCRITGKLISKERLRAVPHATLSIDAKQNMAKRGRT
jgi:RNA polymerase-binding transcription factor DksA